MGHETHSPDAPLAHAGSAPDEPGSPAVATDLDDSFLETHRLRKDGWDGAKMARFCGTLAETGVVTFACRAAGMSAQSAYALRHRNPVFDKAWLAATFIARERLADELLARSIKGGVEQLLKDGAIVAERHTFDNKLAFAILRRLDRRAELGAAFTTPARADIPAPAPAVNGQWQSLLDALSEGREGDARNLLQSPKVDSEVDNPPTEGVEGDNMDEEDLPDPRIWWESGRSAYRTNFPPPEGSDCHEHEQFGHRDYHRSLTDPETATMTARGDALAAKRRAADEAERDAFFASVGEAEVPPPSAAPTPPSADIPSMLEEHRLSLEVGSVLEERKGPVDLAPPPAFLGGGVAKRRRGPVIPDVKSSPDP